MWSHKATSKSFGYDRLISNVAPIGLDQDSLIFNRAIEEIKNTESPFLATITTLTMHGPYEKQRSSGMPPSEDLNITDNRDREYLARLSFFDGQLKIFLDKLKEINKFDNSLIIILGDHDIGQWQVSEKLCDDYIPAIILNSHMKYRQTREVYQTDIFPTILDLMQAKYSYWGVNYRGLGRSIFSSPSADYDGPKEKDYEVSEMIIKAESLP